MSVSDAKRLIEVAFPLKQASLDSVHEKNVRHGHISTLHIWPARRPLAAARAALIATLLPDPGDKEKRDEILKRLAGTVVKSVKRKKLPSGKVEDVVSEETQGGILHWGRESGPDLDWFRAEIRKAYGGRAPKVLDPFAGGGAIPLEAMRLGCEVTAVDINPVAWFILKCTLEYPQKLAGQKRRLPDFALADREFMAAYLKALGLKPAAIRTQLELLARRSPREPQREMFEQLALDPALLDADLAWHVRAWGRWVLREARRELARFYPTYAEFCSLDPYRRVPLAREGDEQLKRVPTNEAGEPQLELLNAGFDGRTYLDNARNPRWVMKPTVAYLWARTVKCKACRATVPLLKTRWLAKKDLKRVVLTMEPNADRTGVVFGIDAEAKVQGGNAAQRREYDKRVGAGTMSRSGAACPCCGTIMTMEDIRLEARAGRMGTVMTAVVVDAPDGKEYRLPTAHEIEAAQAAEGELERVFGDVPFGLPTEPLAGADALGFRVPLYGIDQWHKLYTPRQLVALGILVRAARRLRDQPTMNAYSAAVRVAMIVSLATTVDKVADRGSTICSWTVGWDKVRNTFARFALPMTWDFAESVVTEDTSGGLPGAIEWLARYVEHAGQFASVAPAPTVLRRSATEAVTHELDVIVTDPPYYDAIPYSDLMDFFYVWLRRTLWNLSPEFDAAFAEPLAPKWNHQANDGELIDDASRFGGDKAASKKNYEDGMARAFQACHAALKPDGRLVIVFAHKQPDAWETLVSAIIRAGFVVDGSWPIQTEMGNRMRAMSSAALASSVWLVCRKRDPLARSGWDAQVLKEMETSIVSKLRDFWDAGIRGPDFVWAATGPALEAYSRYPAVKKASEPGALMTVTEFLRHVRRIVVDFVVGRVLTRGEAVATDSIGLDDVTTYYLLHRNDFGLKDAPAGACILYAVSCNLSERQLADQYEILSRGKGAGADEEDEVAEAEEDAEEVETTGGGGMFRLRAWSQRRHRLLGLDTEGGRVAPLVDQVHKLMHLWKGGDVNKVNEYLDSRGLRRSPLFAQLLQALIELAPHGDEERSILESLSNHVRSLGAAAQDALRI
jgi:adenine-specific DNA methylase